MRGMRGMKGAVGNGCGALAIPLIPHSRLPPIDRLHRPINDRQRPPPEEVELHPAYRLDVVLVELRDRVADRKSTRLNSRYHCCYRQPSTPCQKKPAHITN